MARHYFRKSSKKMPSERLSRVNAYAWPGVVTHRTRELFAKHFGWCGTNRIVDGTTIFQRNDRQAAVFSCMCGDNVLMRLSKVCDTLQGDRKLNAGPGRWASKE